MIIRNEIKNTVLESNELASQASADEKVSQSPSVEFSADSGEPVYFYMNNSLDMAEVLNDFVSENDLLDFSSLTPDAEVIRDQNDFHAERAFAGESYANIAPEFDAVVWAEAPVVDTTLIM